MCVSQNNYRLLCPIMLGLFLISGCSGHSLQYGSNSEGQEMGSKKEMNGASDGTWDPAARNADGSLIHGGKVDGAIASGSGAANMVGDGLSDMAGLDGHSGVAGSGSDYGRQFDGADGRGPNQDGVTGFGSGSAQTNNPDPEAWANAYLQGKKSQQGFYGGPEASGSSSGGGPGGIAQYGHDYNGVPGSASNHGGVNGFSQGNASSIEPNPEQWAQAYMNENGGSLPEFVDPAMNIAQANGHQNSHSMGQRDARRELVEIRNMNGGANLQIQDVYFAFDSWRISVEGAKNLKEDAQWLEANPEQSLTIEGHCDQRGTQSYNLVLGKKRAEAAREYLMDLGVPSHRIKIVSYGKERPFCHVNNEDCFQENRRNHMVVRMNHS